MAETVINCGCSSGLCGSQSPIECAGVQHVPPDHRVHLGLRLISTVILSAAIKGVPDALIEAARVDGATNRQIFYK